MTPRMDGRKGRRIVDLYPQQRLLVLSIIPPGKDDDDRWTDRAVGVALVVLAALVILAGWIAP